ncbi:MAG: threonine/serine exporter family protein [Acetobacter sp.]|nr:threonine/serine exporter family protein [Bacteroides sp.]MCM1341574.1 threonine/serine exporter family protein [Acetobacter sp.]MCM1433651.1 threonine/serine exporter family protein [Clostridiales bacterium]
MTKNEIFSLSMDIGQQIMKSGGEIHRAKDTIIRINNAYGNSCVIFALPTLLIAQCNSKTEIRRIEKEELDLAELARLNALSRKLCSNPYDEILITKNTSYGNKFQYPAIFAATFSFCLFFGGNVIDAVLSGIIGIIITLINKSYSDKSLPIFSTNLIEAFFAGILAYLPSVISVHIHPDKIIIGAIMLLVPGLTVVNAMRDMMNSDLIAGFIELINAVMSALAIALGIAVSIFIFNGNS